MVQLLTRAKNRGKTTAWVKDKQDVTSLDHSRSILQSSVSTCCLQSSSQVTWQTFYRRRAFFPAKSCQKWISSCNVFGSNITSICCIIKVWNYAHRKYWSRGSYVRNVKSTPWIPYRFVNSGVRYEQTFLRCAGLVKRGISTANCRVKHGPIFPCTEKRRECEIIAKVHCWYKCGGETRLS